MQVILHLFKPIECTTPRVSPNVTYGLQVVMMGLCRFTDCNECTALLWYFDSEKGVCVGEGSMWDISVPS